MVNEEQALEICEGMVKKFANAYSFDRSNYEDLAIEGKIGVVTAFRNYDPNKGVEFSTYAFSFIRGYMQRYLRDLGTTIKTPRDEPPHKMTSLYKSMSDTCTVADMIEDPSSKDSEDLIIWKDLLSKLPLKEAHAIRYYYFEEKTQQEIGKMLETSQVHVGRLLKQGLRNLRKIYEET